MSDRNNMLLLALAVVMLGVGGLLESRHFEELTRAHNALAARLLEHEAAHDMHLWEREL
jgi:hypothetical protein